MTLEDSRVLKTIDTLVTELQAEIQTLESQDMFSDELYKDFIVEEALLLFETEFSAEEQDENVGRLPRRIAKARRTLSALLMLKDKVLREPTIHNTLEKGSSLSP